MKRAVLFLCLAIFILLVIQPNLSGPAKTPEVRVPKNTDEPVSNMDIAQRQSESGMTIAIDPSVSSATAAGGEPESDVAMDMAAALGTALKKAGYNVVYTRWYTQPDASQTQTEAQEAALISAKENQASLLISLQYNSGTPAQRGFSIFTKPNDPRLDLLAESLSSELTRSSYSISQGIDTDHYANFPVLADESMPAVMLQLGSLVDEQEYEILTRPEFQEQLASAIASSVLETMD